VTGLDHAVDQRGVVAALGQPQRERCQVGQPQLRRGRERVPGRERHEQRVLPLQDAPQIGVPDRAAHERGVEATVTQLPDPLCRRPGYGLHLDAGSQPLHQAVQVFAERGERSNSSTPSSRSSRRICWLTAGCTMCSRSAARPKCSSSATVTK
jgi:hypothetical protein